MKLDSSIIELKYVSSKNLPILQKIGIETIKDLITYFPVGYKDSRSVTSIENLITSENFEDKFLLKVKIKSFKNIFLRTRKTIQEIIGYDNTGEIKIIFFNQPFLSSTFKKDKIFLIEGKLKLSGKKYVFLGADYEEIKDSKENIHLGRITPIYGLTEGLSKKWLRNRIKELIEKISDLHIEDEFGSVRMSETNIDEFLKEIHFPTKFESLEKAITELSLREMANIHLKLFSQKKETFPLKLKFFDFELVKTQVLKNFPFKLTKDQEKILNSIEQKLKKSKVLNELIQGDVGSGKTIISILISAFIAKNGFQIALLAPTTILAKQHFETFSKYLKNTGITINLVTSNSKKTVISDILIGTSAVIARKENLIKKLGLVIVDEQHRFGVEQREILLKPLTKIFPTNHFTHFINMTATPIPRTIAQIFFDELNIHLIKTKPKNRIPIKTRIVSENKRPDFENWLEKLIKEKKEQVYWICPLIQESEKKEISSAKELFEKLKTRFKNLRVGLIHGQLKEKEKESIMSNFKDKKFDILVSTSMIEVGIDVPNATVIAIENAENFGLAQLHQMRGRVGRSEKQSWCFMFHKNKLTTKAQKRLEFLTNNNDGLKIAEYDLQLRGPGEIYGKKQSGIPELKIAKLDNIEIIKESKKIAEVLIKKGINKISLFS